MEKGRIYLQRRCFKERSTLVTLPQGLRLTILS